MTLQPFLHVIASIFTVDTASTERTTITAVSVSVALLVIGIIIATAVKVVKKTRANATRSQSQHNQNPTRMIVVKNSSNAIRSKKKAEPM